MSYDPTIDPESESFDWFAFLARFDETNPARRAAAYARSMRWTTCACGQLCSALPRHAATKQPRDVRLATLGVEFNLLIYDLVMSNDRRIRTMSLGAARQVLREIEKRTTILLKINDKLHTS